ncbi:MAG TPA: hypothetical protein VHV27_05730 [Phenylobacterium sp.]|jgi:hypothetical protein|nr:hypothetical protein [Phenylobacterium sp.]
MPEQPEEMRLHENVKMVGLRATVTAVGFLKLVGELADAGVLDQAAVGRIKQAIFKEITLGGPTTGRAEYERTTQQRIDRLFSGEVQLERVPAD